MLGGCNVTVTNFHPSTDTSMANAHWGKVDTCYSAVDRFFPACGLFDLTEGIYNGNPKTPYEQAEANQLDYLLDQVRCEPGRRVLDLGCGYGTLLERIRQRDANGVGITISAEQVRCCRQKNLDVHLLDYRAIPGEWDRTFDGVIANGSIEHFVRPTNAAAGRMDDIYHHLFAKVHRLIDLNSTERWFATTTIHSVRKPADPLDLLRNPFTFRWGSDNFHWSVLERLLSGGRPAAPVCERVFQPDRGSRWDRGLPVDLRRMGTIDAPGYAIPAGGEDRRPVKCTFGSMKNYEYYN